MRLHILVLQESDLDMKSRLIIDGNAVYEIDEECMKRKQNRGSIKGVSGQNSFQRPGKDNGQSRS
jgi:hypothetical protein